jgi:hypothetical protein
MNFYILNKKILQDIITKKEYPYIILPNNDELELTLNKKNLYSLINELIPEKMPLLDFIETTNLMQLDEKEKQEVAITKNIEGYISLTKDKEIGSNLLDVKAIELLAELPLFWEILLENRIILNLNPSFQSLKIPTLIRDITSNYNYSEYSTLATLGALSFVCSNNKFLDNGNMTSLNLFIQIYANPGTNKSHIKCAEYLLEDVDNESNGLYLKKLEAYNKLSKEEKSKTKKPIRRKYILGGNNSTKAILNSLDSLGKIIIIETEADVINEANKSEWGDYSTILRKAYHNENITLNRAEESYEIINPRLSLLITGTPNQLHDASKKLANGELSRSIFWFDDGECDWKKRADRLSIDLNKILTPYKNLFRDIFNESELKPKSVVFDPEYIQLEDRVLSCIHKELISSKGPEIHSIVARFNINLMRVAALFRISEMVNEGTFIGAETIIVNKDNFFDAINLLLCCLNNAEEIYDKALSNSDLNNKASSEIKEAILSTVKKEINIQQSELVKIIKNKDFKERSVYNNIDSLVKEKLLLKSNSGFISINQDK